MDNHKPGFTIAEAADLAGLPPATLRDWFNKKPGKPAHFGLRPEDKDAPAGGTRQISLHTTLAVVIAAKLARLGVPVPRAAVAGLSFGHTASGHPKREHPGALYSQPGSRGTMLALDADGNVRIFPLSTVDDVLDGIGDDTAALMIIDPLVRRVLDAASDLESGRAARPSPASGAKPASGRPHLFTNIGLKCDG